MNKDLKNCKVHTPSVGKIRAEILVLLPVTLVVPRRLELTSEETIARESFVEDLSGRHWGPYQLVSPLGVGGMAAVYKAYQSNVARYVAVKVLPRQLSEDSQFKERFEQEAKLLAGLQHPHILPVFDFGEAEGYTYIVMPLMQAGTLAELLRGQPLPLARVKEIITQAGRALDYAHGKGLIHRDIKPSNILLDEQGNILLSDFGIAKLYGKTTALTRTGAILGTPAYMSPEQGAGQQIDRRSDIYSLGVVLYEMVTGRVPFEADTPIAVVFKHIQDPLPPPRSFVPHLPERVEIVIRRALAKNPEERFATAGQMADALNGSVGIAEVQSTLLDEHKPPASPSDRFTNRIVGIGVVTLVILSLTAGGLWAALGQGERSLAVATASVAGSSGAETGERGIVAGSTSTEQPSATFTRSPNTSFLDTTTLTSTPAPSPTITSPPATNTPRPPTNTPPPPTDTSPPPTNTPPPPTNTSPPLTDTPSPPTQAPVSPVLVLDSFEYGSVDALRNNYWINAPGNTLALSLDTSQAIAGQYALAMSYSIVNNPPSDYVGMERQDMTAMDWRDYTRICLWIGNRGFEGHLVLQFREQNSEIWKTEIQMRNIIDRDVCVPLNENSFFLAEQSSVQNSYIDLSAIDNFALYLGNGGITEGVIYLDQLELRQ